METARLPVLLMFLLSSIGCGAPPQRNPVPRLDTTSQESYEESLAEIKEGLSSNERKELDGAIAHIEADHTLTRELLHEKSAHESLALVYERELESLLAEIKEADTYAQISSLIRVTDIRLENGKVLANLENRLDRPVKGIAGQLTLSPKYPDSSGIGEESDLVLVVKRSAGQFSRKGNLQPEQLVHPPGAHTVGFFFQNQSLPPWYTIEGHGVMQPPPDIAGRPREFHFELKGIQSLGGMFKVNGATAMEWTPPSREFEGDQISRHSRVIVLRERLDELKQIIRRGARS